MPSSHAALRISDAGFFDCRQFALLETPVKAATNFIDHAFDTDIDSPLVNADLPAHQLTRRFPLNEGAALPHSKEKCDAPHRR
jgi:hypothetical protein